MINYQFENLDAKLFEHLAVALGQFHIVRGLRPFGQGPDGGREATYSGRMDYPSRTQPWDGYLVVQCKKKESRGATPKEEADWAIAQLDDEMERYRYSKVPRRIPEYFLFVTNAELSAKPGDGGKDRFVARLEYWVQELGLKAADVWDRDKLATLLNGTQTVAQRFGLLHAGDIINYAAQAVLGHRQGIETTLSVFLQEEMRADQFVRLAQAGHAGDERTPLARVFVDLRVTDEDSKGEGSYVVKKTQIAFDRPVYPSLLEKERQVKNDDSDSHYNLFGPAWTDPSRFVVVGGPGQGKSTVVQQIAQRHRAALLARHPSSAINYDTANAVAAVRAGAEESGLGLPGHPRLPFRIVLEQFADALAKGETGSVLDFIGSIVRKRTARPFNHDDAERLLREIPWLVALDGLDEVPAVSNRADVMGAVRRFLDEARAVDADLVVIATTRPQGYEDEFSPAYFSHLYLASLSRQEAIDYARKFVDTKYVGDSDRRERVLKRLEVAAEEEATARLMVSPLQVTIMAALVDLVGNPPRERYPLFDRYYDVVYQREQERGLGSSEVLAEHQTDINALHDRAGLLLQIATETAGRSQGRLSGDDLRRLVSERLKSVGYDGEELQRITDNLIEVAVNRLVFVVPLEEDQYGFEVRSLQEFAAARAIMRRGTADQIKRRLSAIAPVPYWRNTVLFAVGLIFAEREDLTDTVAQLCRELNEDETDPTLYHSRAGSRLALDILQDGVVDRRPAHRRSLLETALQLLDRADSRAATQLADLYRPEDETRYITAIRGAVSRVFGDGAGAFVLLAMLANDEVEWAGSLLQELWPEELDRARWILESVAVHLRWEEWQIVEALRVARNSSPEWVAAHLSERLGTDWIQDAASLQWIHQECIRNSLNGNEANITYLLPEEPLKGSLIERIAKANTVDLGWQPYLLAQSFILDMTAAGLAIALDSLATLPSLDVARNAALPWPLLAIVRSVNEPEELKEYALRARAGELGDAHTWAAAEKRWTLNGFAVHDWMVFDDATFPFDRRIADQGVIAIGYSLRHSDAGIVNSIAALKQAFSVTSSRKVQRTVAESLVFCLALHGEVLSEAADISLREMSEVVSLTRWGMHPLAFVSVIDDNQDLAEMRSFLPSLGDKIRLTEGDPSQSVSRRGVQDVTLAAHRVSTLLQNDASTSGLVRALAGLASLGAVIKNVPVDLNSLTVEGLVALVALDLFADGATGASPTEIARLIAELSNEVNSHTGYKEIPAIVERAAMAPISSFRVAVFDAVLRRHRLGFPVIKRIMDGFQSATAYRTSGLDNVENRLAIGL